MDEAFSALDPLIRHDMQGLLLELQATLHKTIVFITHDIDEAMRIGRRIAILRDGRLVQTGTPTEILQRPADDYVRRFVDKRSNCRYTRRGAASLTNHEYAAGLHGARRARRVASSIP